MLLHENGTVQEAALCPSYERTTVKAGRVVAWRRTQRWVDSGVGVGSCIGDDGAVAGLNWGLTVERFASDKARVSRGTNDR